MKFKRRAALARALLAAFAPCARAAHGAYEGTVTAGETITVRAGAGGTLERVFLEAGQLAQAGQAAARVRTQKVYAPMDGTVTALAIQPGGDASGENGAALRLEPLRMYTLSASAGYAYTSANALVHIGETVTLMCIIDGTHRGRGVIVSVDQKTYTVQAIAGEFYVGEAVNVYRGSECVAAARVGRATVARADNASIAGEGTVVAVYAQNGDRVEKGELLFETVTDDGTARAPGAETRLETGGIVTRVYRAEGEAVSAGDALFDIAPVRNLTLTCALPEAACAGLRVGDRAQAAFACDKTGARYEAAVISVSQIASAGEDGAVFSVCLALAQPPEGLRLGLRADVFFPAQNE